MRIAIEVNGVLRDTIGKLKQTYEKFLIEKSEDSNFSSFDITDEKETIIEDESFEYSIIEPITSLEIDKFFKFRDDEEKLNFLYEDFPMQIFGHSSSTENSTFNDLNNFYLDFRDKNEIYIISDEIGKSKPATLFFLSKFGCLIENIIFYNSKTLDKVITSFDLIVTSNPDLIINYSDSVKFIKFETEYNKQTDSELVITSLKQLSEKINIIEDVKTI